MNIQLISKQLRTIISQFIGFKDYTPNGIEKLKQLENSIINFSKTADCLYVCMNILESETVQQIQYFASMLLKDKLKYDFDQLQSNKIQQTHKRISQIICFYQQPTMIVMNNLTLCLIYVYMHFSEIMGDPLQYLKVSIGQASNHNYILKFLQLLPQEIDNSKVVIDEQVRINSRKQIQKYQKSVLIELGIIGGQLWKNPKIRKNVLLGCFKNWVEIGYDSQIINNLVNHPLMIKAIQHISDPLLSDSACDCITGILNTMRGPQENIELFNYLSKVIDILTEKVTVLVKDGEIELAQNYVGILCDFSNKAKRVFITNHNQKIHKFLETLVRLVKEQELSCFHVMMEFWLNFLDQLQDHPLQQHFIKLLKELFSSICFKIQFPFKFMEQLNQISQDKLCKLHKEADDLIDKRQDSKDVFVAIGRILGKEAIVKEVFLCLQKINQEDKKYFWQTLQVYIFALSYIVDNYPSLTNEIILIVKTYDDLKPTHVIVKMAYLRLFRSLMTIEQKDVLFIQQLFIYISSMLSDKLLSDKAEKAFSRACQQNPTIVCTNIGDFMALLGQHSAKQNILKGVLGILNSDEYLMKQYLPSILLIYCQKIQKGPTKSQMKQSIISLTTIVKTITKEDPKAYQESIQKMLVQLWPMIKQSFLNPPNLDGDEDPHVQRCVKLLKVIMRSIKSSFTQFLNQIFQTTFEAYQKYPICSYLYLLQVSITVYYQFPSYLSYFRDLYCSFCDLTFTHINSHQKIQKYQFLVDDFIGMNKRFFVYNAEIALKTDKIHLILDLVELCSGSSVYKVSKASYQLLEVLYAFNWTDQMINDFNKQEDHQPININSQNQKLYQPVREILIKRTDVLLMKMLDQISNSPYQSIAQAVLDTLLAEIKAFPLLNSTIWGNLLPAIPQDILTRKEKDKFLNLLPIIDQQDAEKTIIKILRTMNKRFRNRKHRETLK